MRLVVRAGELGGSSASGPDADLDALVAKEAEAVYAETQPYRYSKYLEEQGRTAEALAVARKLATSDAPPSERAWAYAQISNLVANDGDFAGGAVAAREALRLSPRLAIAEINLEGAEQLLGHDEAALHSLERRRSCWREHQRTCLRRRAPRSVRPTPPPRPNTSATTWPPRKSGPNSATDPNF